VHAILHMGPPKTGTSAIQLGLLQNTDRLRRDGMLLSNTVGQQNGNSGILAANLIGPIANDPRPPTKDARPLFQDEVAAFTGDTIIISAEAFFNRLLNFGDNLSANARLDRMKPRLAHLLFELAQHGITSVSAVLVLRNEADRYVSGLVQRVQSMTRLKQPTLTTPLRYNVPAVGQRNSFAVPMQISCRAKRTRRSILPVPSGSN